MSHKLAMTHTVIDKGVLLHHFILIYCNFKTVFLKLPNILILINICDILNSVTKQADESFDI